MTNDLTSIAAMLLVIFGTCAVIVPVTVGAVLQFQKHKDKLARKFGPYRDDHAS
jgi:hypothetical protein